MTPLSFESFRNRLENASGFQSRQFREVEFWLGHRSDERLQKMPEELRPQLKKYMERPSLWQSFLKFLSLNGYEVATQQFSTGFHLPTQEKTVHKIQDLLVKVYRDNSLLADLCERFVDLDEGLQEWRYRHVKMVERTIGMKMGTGGSPGVGYLAQTLFKPLFPDLWEIRARF